MAISKKIRFEVFKRDGFKCAYCGNTPPTVILEVDHIDPKSKGGKDDINNLITSCFDCNRGKRDIPLSKIPSKASENLEILKAQEEQIKEYRKFMNKVEKRINKDIKEIEVMYEEYCPWYNYSEKTRKVSIRKFLSLLPKHEVIEAMDIALGNRSIYKNAVFSYFCGVCWTKIKARKGI